MEAPKAHFRPALTPFLVVASLLFGMFAAVVVGSDYFRDRLGLQTLQYVLIAAAASVALFVVLVLSSRPYGVSFFADGIRGRNAWGERKFIPWSQIGEAQTDDPSESGLLVLVIKSKAPGIEIWTYPDVVYRDEAQRLIRELTKGECPLLAERSAA